MPGSAYGGDSKPVRRAPAYGGGDGPVRRPPPLGVEDRRPRRSEGDGRPERPPPGTPAPSAPSAAPAQEAAGGASPLAIERIAKVMARAGLCSRRDAEAWIEAGRVAVNRRVLRSAAINVGPSDRIEVDGQPLPERERTRLWRYHKPAGLMTTAWDPEGRPTVFGALPSELPRVVTVGRLDINTEGLLLLTNDGGLARVLAHPETGWVRRYRVRAHGEITQAMLDSLRGGVSIDGIHYGPIEARIDREQGSNVWITMDLREGKNREVKRVFEHLGASVNRLIRVSFGPFQLGDLPEGAVEEVRQRHLRDQLGVSLAEQAGVDFEAPLRGAGEERTGGQGARAQAYPREEAEEPVRRIQVGTTADRKGRSVRVERITHVGEQAPTIRRAGRDGPARERDSGERGAGGPGRPPSGDQPMRRPARREEGQERFARPARREEPGGERDAPPRGRSAGFGARPAPSGDQPMRRPAPREGGQERFAPRPARRDEAPRREGAGGGRGAPERERSGFGPGRAPAGEQTVRRPQRREEGEERRPRPAGRDGEAGRGERSFGVRPRRDDGGRDERPRGPGAPRARPPRGEEERPARRFGPPKGARGGDVLTTRPPRFDAGPAGRPAREGREERPGRGGPPPGRSRPPRREDGPAREERGGPRPEGARPRSAPRAGGGAEPQGFKPGGFKPGGSRPGGPPRGKPGGFKPGGFKPGGFKPGGERPGGGRPGEDRPRGDRPGGFGPPRGPRR